MNDEKKRILLVEDEAVIAMAHADLLTRFGYEAATAGSGEEAVRLLNEGFPANLILMDVDLGEGMDGTEAAEIILRERDIPIVFLSSHNEPEVVEKTEKITSYGYVVKNSGSTVLDASIKMAFRLHDAHMRLKGQREDLEAANEELHQAIEELEAANEDLMQSQEAIVERDRALTESEEIFRAAAESVTDIIYIWDLATDRVQWIGEIDEFYGFERDSFPRDIDAFVNALHPDDRELIVSMAREGMENRTQWIGEFRVIRADGEVAYAWGTGVALFDRNGTPSKVVGSLLDITDQKHVQTRLAESEERYRGLFENSLSGILYISLEGTILESNPKLLSILGSPSFDETKKINVFTFKPLVDIGFSDDVKNCIEERKNIFNEKTYTSAWGKTAHVNYYLTPITRGNEIIAVMASLEDISELKQAEEALRIAENVTRALINVPSDIMAIINGEGTIIDISEYAAALVNVSREELIGRSVLSLVGKENESQRRKYLNKILETGETIRYETESYGQWFDVVLQPVRKNGDIDMAVIMARNITEKKKTEKALRESETRFRDLAELMPEIIFELDMTGRLTYSNQEAFDRMDYTRDEFDRGVSGLQMIAPEDRDRAAKNIATIMGGTFIGPSEYTGIRKNGSRFPVTIHSIPVYRDGVITGIRGILVDITERKRGEDEIRNALEQKEALLRELQHRVKNSFSLITSLVSLEARRTGSEEARTVLKDIHNRIMSMNNLYSMLYESGSVQEVSLDRYCGNIVQTLRSTYADMAGMVKVETDLKPVTMDVKRAATLGLILTELITNAYKHAFSGDMEGRVRVTLGQAGPEGVITVTTGSPLFPVDFDLDRDSGTGLELAKVLSRQLRGSLELVRGEYSGFRVTFPMTADRSA